MWVEELSDTACPLGGFAHICNECGSRRIGIHHSDLFGRGFHLHQSQFCAGCRTHGLRHRSFKEPKFIK